MSKTTSLFIDEAGNVEAIHSDFVDGLNLGEKDVVRVSDVEFDNATQRWYAEIRREFWPTELQELADARLTVWADTRQEVLDKEHTYVQNFLRAKFYNEQKAKTSTG